MESNDGAKLAHPDPTRLESLGADSSITRRDFIGGMAIGSGVALLGMPAPGARGTARAQTVPSSLADLTPAWTGPGGLGDYASANGNTHAVVNAAHQGIRNEAFLRSLRGAKDTGEDYDLVVVGCGLAGLAACHKFNQERPNATALILDQHPIFGGEARQNEFEVDGYRLLAPQGATSLIGPLAAAKRHGYSTSPLWNELGFPDDFVLQKPTGLKQDILIPEDPWAPMHFAWWRADTGFYYGDGKWVKNPWRDGFAEAPISNDAKLGLLRTEMFRTPPHRDDWAQWLDSMTYEQFLKDVVGLQGDELRAVVDFHRPVGSAYGMGLGGDVISAYQAFQFLQPGVSAYFRYQGDGGLMSDDTYFPCYPNGHSLIARMLVKKVIPGAFNDQYSIRTLINDQLNWNALDKPDQPVRMRLSATVVSVTHDGAPGDAKQVVVHYLRDGKIQKVRAKGAILAGQQHVNRHICRDAAPELLAAMSQFDHAPMLNVNVAVRNWRFLEKRGVAAARWFQGLGWWLTLRRQIETEGVTSAPLDPNKPTVFTLYTPFAAPGLPIKEQCTAARMQMFGLSYAQIEAAIREQFTEMFASTGFDAKRDIAGIITNRFGHAYLAVPPNFYFGSNGKEVPKDVLRKPYHRIDFAHSELAGYQMWETATDEGRRAATQMLDVV